MRGEVNVQHGRNAIWTRLELLQTTGAELQIHVTPANDESRWVSALTVGATRHLGGGSGLNVAAGAAITVNGLPESFSSAYGSRTPVTVRLYLQLEGSRSARARHED